LKRAEHLQGLLCLCPCFLLGLPIDCGGKDGEKHPLMSLDQA
jgi:hypothetical protein